MLTTPNTDKDVKQQKFSLVVGIQNGTVTLENSFVVSYKTINVHII